MAVDGAGPYTNTIHLRICNRGRTSIYMPDLPYIQIMKTLNRLKVLLRTQIEDQKRLG